MFCFWFICFAGIFVVFIFFFFCWCFMSLVFIFLSLVLVSSAITFWCFWHCKFGFPYFSSSIFASPSDLCLFFIIFCFPNYFSFCLIIFWLQFYHSDFFILFNFFLFVISGSAIFSFSIPVSPLICAYSSSFLLCSWISKSHSCVSFSAFLSSWGTFSSSWVSQLSSFTPFISWSILCWLLLLHYICLPGYTFLNFFSKCWSYMSISFSFWSAHDCSTGNISRTNLCIY